MASDRSNDPRRVANLEVAQSVAGIDDQSAKRPRQKFNQRSSVTTRGIGRDSVDATVYTPGHKSMKKELNQTVREIVPAKDLPKKGPLRNKKTGKVNTKYKAGQNRKEGFSVTKEQGITRSFTVADDRKMGPKRDRSKDLGQVKRDRKAANAGGATKTPKKQRKATEAVVTKFNAYRREIARRPANVKGFMPQSDGGNTWPVKSRTAKQRASSGVLKKGKK